MRQLIQHLTRFSERKPTIFSSNEREKWEDDINKWEEILGCLGLSVDGFLEFKWHENEKPENKGRVLSVKDAGENYICSEMGNSGDKMVYGSELAYLLSMGALFRTDEFGEFRDAPIIVGEIHRAGNGNKFLRCRECVVSCFNCRNKANCRFLEYCHNNHFSARILPHFFKDVFEQYAPELLTGK